MINLYRIILKKFQLSLLIIFSPHISLKPTNPSFYCPYSILNNSQSDLNSCQSKKRHSNDLNQTIISGLVHQTVSGKPFKYKFFQQSKVLFPFEFLNNIQTVLNRNPNQIEQQTLTIAKQLLEINELSIYHMAQKINDLTQTETKKSAVSTVRQGTNRIQPKDYQILQEAVQKAEQQIRKHIGIEHQMKICLEELQDELDVLTLENQDLKKQNQFLKKQLSSTKKKQIQIVKKLNQTESKIQLLEQRFRLSKPNSKLITQPQAMISHDDSHASLKKSFDQNKEKQRNSKKQLLSKNGGYSKLGSRKTSKLGLLNNEIDVNLHNFMTINTQIKKEQPTKTQGKEIFWNKRLKKKDGTMIQGEYSSIHHNAQNRSLNISPRQLKRRQKEKDLKDVYATNSREFRKSYQPAVNEDTVTKKKQRRDYSNGEAYQIKRSVLGKGLIDRSRSVVH